MMKYLLLFISAGLMTACSSGRHTTCIVLLPDTQNYAAKFPEIVQSQTDWIKKQAATIDLVLQQGDLTNANGDKQWLVIQKAFQKLDSVVPYVLAAGNHDMGSAPGKVADIRNTDLFNKYFPAQHMKRLPGFAGLFEENKMENAWYLLQTRKTKWLILTLEFGPRNKVLDWANKIVADHPDRTVILNTHSYMYSDSTRQGPGDNWRPQSYGLGAATGDDAVNDGEDIWNKLVKLHPNIRFVFSGHILNTGVGTLVSKNDHGYPVYQMLANYQSGVIGSEKGGNGWLRILRIHSKKKQVSVKTYSPFLDKTMDSPEHNFVISNSMIDAGKRNQ